MSDEITLTLPREEPFYGIAHLVLGGLAVRLDLTVDGLEDLRLALDELLGTLHADGDVTVRVRVDGDTLTTAVGPFEGEHLRAQLERGGEMTLGRVLGAVADNVVIGERDGGHWVELTKTVRTAPG